LKIENRRLSEVEEIAYERKPNAFGADASTPKLHSAARLSDGQSVVTEVFKDQDGRIRHIPALCRASQIPDSRMCRRDSLILISEAWLAGSDREPRAGDPAYVPGQPLRPDA
jgi:hypothetical protein